MIHYDLLCLVMSSCILNDHVWFMMSQDLCLSKNTGAKGYTGPSLVSSCLETRLPSVDCRKQLRISKETSDVFTFQISEKLPGTGIETEPADTGTTNLANQDPR